MRGLPVEIFHKLNMMQDHPRLCGDYVMAVLGDGTHPGSPPPVRGLQRKLRNLQEMIGITPACAGTTAFTIPSLFSARDHPRLCGDYHAIIDSYTQFLGSPPPVRGLLKKEMNLVADNRITPACAGTTVSIIPRIKR